MTAVPAVEVWRTALDGLRADLDCLSRDEMERGERYAFDEDRRRYLTRASFVRHVLSGYTQVPAAAVSIERTPQGKPFLQGRDVPYFSVSHAGGCCVMAVAGVEVGIDVERVSDSKLPPALLARVLTPLEQEELARLEGAARATAFLRAWTRKEALSKVLGSGLGAGFSSIQVGVAELATPLLPWAFVEVDVPGDHLATVAVRGVAASLSYKDPAGDLFFSNAMFHQ